MKIAWFLAYSC